MKHALVSILLMAWVGGVRAQPAPAPAAAPTEVNTESCLPLDLAPGALLEPLPAPGALDTPLPWSDFAITGQLVDDTATVHALLEPTLLQYRTTLSAAKWPLIAKVIAQFGYQLVGHWMQDTRLNLQLAPLPMVRKVDVDMPQGLFSKLLDDEVRRRMQLRIGAYLPWEPTHRQCALLAERQRIEEFLHDEGYFEADVRIVHTAIEDASVKLRVNVTLGAEYTLGKLSIPTPTGESLALGDAEIRAQFHHEPKCIPVIGIICVGSGRFTRTVHQEDIQHLKELFHKRGFPAVRIQSSFDPRVSFDRRTHTVNIVLTIDPRRRVDVRFEGKDRAAVSEDDLRAQLTFDRAGSADDVEIAQSARAIQTFLQTRGYFDAHVTAGRETIDTRREVFDRVTFRIDPGQTREVTSVEFVGNHAIATPVLEGVVAIKEARLSGALLGTNTAATSAQLAEDIDRIRETYRRAGYRETRVRVSASTDPAGLDNAALTAALVEAERGNGLNVRYTIDEGEPTLLTRVELEHADTARQLEPGMCEQLLRELSGELAEPQLAGRADPKQCVALAANLPFREDDVVATRDRLRDFLFKIGRPRARVEYETRVVGPHRVVAHYRIDSSARRTIGKVVIRGNFHTRRSIIVGELQFHEGDVLTADALANAARRLRNTGLFNAVNIDMPDLGNDSSLVVNAIVRVEERYDHLAQIDVGGGYSSFNGLFGTITWAQRNLRGLGLGLTATATYGTLLQDYESSFIVPQWLVRRFFGVSPDSLLAFRTELTGLYRQQDTQRFGLLTTEGATLGLSKAYPRQRTATLSARTITGGIHYDFRVRNRNVDALRPIGIDLDESQVAVSTRTGQVGAIFDWDQRVDRRGQLAPLSPEAGFRLDASISWAAPIWLGQDTFLKVSATGSKFIPIGNNMVIRADLRYDQGIPLGGAVLLPEVERFFAGGDSTVRGYADDRLATELIQVAVPPIGNVTQIRTIPAGGNIRVLSSIDGQIRIWKVLAGAMFFDTGMITNQWGTVTVNDIRPGVGMGLRVLTPFGILALEYAVPIHPHLGDDPRGRIHFYFAARAQF